MSAACSICFVVGFPARCRARVSMRISTGAGPACAACSVAMYLKLLFLSKRTRFPSRMGTS